jgi:hypothetical protein
MASATPAPSTSSGPPAERPAENPWTKRNLLTIAGLTAIGFLIAQRWSGLDTPDSSFYASLALFGDEVTDRAPDDSYFWTRLGYIAPVRGLTLLLGPWIGFAVYKALLLMLITGSAYLLLKRHMNWVSAAFLTATVTTSTVVLSYLGNSYLTGTVLAGTAVLIALGTSPRAASSAVAGVTMGWLAMVNPAGALLAGFLLGLGWTVTLDGPRVEASLGQERLLLEPVLDPTGLDRIIVARAWPRAPGASEADLAAFARELNDALNVGQFRADSDGLVFQASLPFLEELDPQLLVAFLAYTADVRLAVLQVQGERALLAPVEGEQRSR